jgi:hypothetical protein
MVVEHVAELVRTIARESGASRALRADPERLGARLGLDRAEVAALRSADRFFRTEKPILDLPRPPRPFVAPPEQRARAVAAAAASIAVSADTGTLLPGPDTGTLTDSGLPATASLTVGPPQAPAVPPIVPQTPFPMPAPGVGPMPMAPAPFMPQVPGQPAAPLLPGIPYPAPFAGPAPGVFPGPAPSFPAAPPGMPALPPGCCCEAAVVALVGLVSTTAQAAHTAIVAISAQARQGRGR